MKKTYIQPSVEVAFIQASEMLALSLPIINQGVDGGQAKVKKNDWDIFGTDEDDLELE